MVSKNINSIIKKYFLYKEFEKEIYIPLIFFLTMVVLLVLGVGKYQLIAIGSGSM